MDPNRPVVVLTGSSGLIGSSVCDVLRDGCRVVGFDRPGAPHRSASAENVPCEITSKPSVIEALDRVQYAFGDRIATVVHCRVLRLFGRA
jgi:nucleoside-diphosphate-sugar epimerase